MAHRGAPNTVGVIVMMTAALVASVLFGRRPELQAATADVKTIPQQAQGWKSQGDVELDENTMKQILADSYVSRQYTNPAGQVVQLLVVYRRYGRREFAHRPELCFPAAGYEITKKNNETLPYGGRQVPVKYLTATRPGARDETITYFFASGKKTEEDFLQQQMWMAFERLAPNKNGWTFIRLTSPTMTTPEDALAAQKEFMQALAPGIETAITTDNNGAGGATTAMAAR